VELLVLLGGGDSPVVRASLLAVYERENKKPPPSQPMDPGMAERLHALGLGDELDCRDEKKDKASQNRKPKKSALADLWKWMREHEPRDLAAAILHSPRGILVLAFSYKLIKICIYF
jgi:hypothetical protein